MKEQILQTLQAKAEDVFYVVDVSSFIFRAYYSTGYLSRSDGTPTGAVFGVANMMVSLLKDFEPAYIAIAMDSKTPTFRKDIYPEYKANRPPPPDDLKVQFPMVEELVNAFGFTVLQKDGFEADDIIATAAHAAAAKGLKTVVVSGDKDLLQLVSGDAVMLDTMKKKIWDPAAVTEKWMVPPSLVGDLLALAGDSSDNIPGVPRVGPKTAAPLLNELGGLFGIFENLEKIKSKAMQKRLAEHREDALLSRRLVALNHEVPLDWDIGNSRFERIDDALAPVLEKLEFHKLIDRLFQGYAGEVTSQESDVDVTYRTITSLDELKEIGVQIEKAGRFAVDLETTSVDAVIAEIVGVALCYQAYEGFYIPVAHKQGACIPLTDVLAVVGPLLENPSIEVIVQNIKYEDTIFRRHGIVIQNVPMDPMLASYLLRAQERSHSLDALAKVLLGRTLKSYDEVTEKGRGTQLLFNEVSVENATEYAAEDAEVAFDLARTLEREIDAAKMTELLTAIEIPLARVLCKMELAGVIVNTDRLKEMSDEFAGIISTLEVQAYELAGRSFNLASPKQLQEILFDELNLPTQKKTKTGYSTDSEVLETLAFMHDLPKILLEHRNLTKLKNTYLDALPRQVNPQTGRIHTSFNQAIAATGRLSSTNPNLQNIPIRTERGRDIRKAFVAKEGCVLLSADYSQIELRILAHLSKDDALKDAYINNRDIHERTARAVFGLAEDVPVAREQRAIAKTVNFGVIYGKTAFSLSKELGITRPEAQRFIDTYFELYQGVARYMEEVVQQVKAEKAVYTLLGRKRDLPEIDSKNFNVRQHAERMARNMPIQGTAADLLKVAMIRVDAALENGGYDAQMLLTVHDELVLEVPESEVDAVMALVVLQMEGAMTLDVPLKVEAGVGPDWDAAH
ncbi:MAG: DNA polymerase I [Deltaproteobacteria bacterium]|nr:DNA polymerase I [Deltaproteobacteria bacterium]MBN2670578.1 DNA polymerase I [Deltaproteobacteria bacterium]